MSRKAWCTIACRTCLPPARGNALDARKQHSAAAVVLLQAPGADLDCEPPRDRRHRREYRQAAVGLSDGIERDEGRAAGERRVEQLRFWSELLEAEQRLAPARQPVFGHLQLLDLDDQLAVPGIADPGTGVLIVPIEKTRPDSRAGSHHQFVARVHERAHARGRQRDAELAVLDLSRQADTHSETSCGPR